MMKRPGLCASGNPEETEVTALEKKGILAEFKEFISRGNVVDMAVGVIVGAAFKGIVDSLVGDIVMPLIGAIADTSSFSDIVVHVGGAEVLLGNFIGQIINFFLIAVVIFAVVKTINTLREKLEKKEEPAPEPPAGPTTEELLGKILEELQKKN